MFVTSQTRLRFALMLASGFVVSIASTVSHAYTFEQQQACSGDAFRLCSSEIPDVDRITACMVRSRSQLSPQCRAFFHGGAESGEIAADPSGRPPGVRPAAARKPGWHRIRKLKADAS